MHRFQLKLLGGFDSRLASGPVLDIAARKTRALLAYLALPAGRAHTRDKLVGLLWSDRADEQARSSLRQALTELGKAFGAAEPLPLIKARDTVALDPAIVGVDALDFERLATSNLIGELRRATALYAGDLLDGLDIRDEAFEEWLAAERQRLRALAVAAFKKLLTQESGPSAIAVAHRLLALDPLQEEGHRALMRLHAAAGETGTALRQYELCRDMLKNELNAAPSPETETLHHDIRKQSGGSVPQQQGSGLVPDPDGDNAVRPDRDTLKPSIAVLPFHNRSDEPAQQYFSDGITEDIITELSRFRELFVIARNSSFQYRGNSVDVKRIGRELGVSYLVEGSVRKAGNRIRVTAQLVEAAKGAHIWAEHYDRDLQDIFAVQDEVTQTIVATLVGRLSASGADSARRKSTKHWASYDYFLQGRACVNRWELDMAEPLLRRAIELDPEFAGAYAMLARLCLFRSFFDAGAAALNESLVNAKYALSLDENDALCHMQLSSVYLFMNRFDLAGVHSRKSIALNPSDMEVACGHAHWLARIGRTKEALEKLDIAIQRDPFPPVWYWELRAVPLLQERRYEEFLEAYSHIGTLQVWHHPYLAIAKAHLGRTAEAKAHAADVLRLKPDYSAQWIIAMEPYENPVDLEHLLDGLRKAGLPD